MSDTDPRTPTPNLEAISQHVDISHGARVGNIILGQEQLPNPEETLAKIDALLTQPDEQGRRLPQIIVTKAHLERFPEGQLAYIGISSDEVETQVSGNAEIVWDYKSESEWIRQVRIPGGDGLGRSFYLEMARSALSHGHDFRSSDRLRKGGREAWQRLVELKVAQIATETDSETGFDHKYYVVNGNNRPKNIVNTAL